MPMKNPQENILLVEADPELCDLIDRQTLRPLGYRVKTASSAAAAIQAAIKTLPDLIIADLELPGLSGKDLLVALSSQGIDAPVVVLAKRGMEADIIQAFRLGAADYLLLPGREAEVVSAVERALTQVRARLDREQLASQLNQANQELQRRVKELTAIFAIGKAVTSITEQRTRNARFPGRAAPCKRRIRTALASSTLRVGSGHPASRSGRSNWLASPIGKAAGR